MLEYRLGPADLGAVRFARSPMLELACSVQVLTGGTGQAMHATHARTCRASFSRGRPAQRPGGPMP